MINDETNDGGESVGIYLETQEPGSTVTISDCNISLHPSIYKASIKQLAVFFLRAVVALIPSALVVFALYVFVFFAALLISEMV